MVHGTWNEVQQFPPHVRPLPSDVILKAERDASSQLAHLETTLVARGNFHNDVTDYKEIYGPDSCIALIRVLLAVASVKRGKVRQADVKGAFIHADFLRRTNCMFACRKLRDSHARTTK